jgi:hypothetical protein
VIINLGRACSSLIRVATRHLLAVLEMPNELFLETERPTVEAKNATCCYAKSDKQ